MRGVGWQPVMLNLAGRRCLIVGGGATGLRRARWLLDAGAVVTVVAPELEAGFESMDVQTHRRAFEPGDLEGVFLVVTAAGPANVNEAVATEAARRGVLVNRADDAAAGDVQPMSQHRAGPLTLAVHTGGASASAAGTIRDELAAHVDPLWPELLERARAMRSRVQHEVADPARRRDVLRRLTDEQSRSILRTQGPDALDFHWQRLLWKHSDVPRP